MTQTLPARETQTHHIQALGGGLVVSLPAAARLVPDEQFALHSGASGEYPTVPWQFGGPIVNHAFRLAHGETLILPDAAQPAPAREPIPATYGTPATSCSCCAHAAKPFGASGRRRRVGRRVSPWTALAIAVGGGIATYLGVAVAAVAVMGR